jgi:hypothetical protein
MSLKGCHALDPKCPAEGGRQILWIEGGRSSFFNTAHDSAFFFL